MIRILKESNQDFITMDADVYDKLFTIYPFNWYNISYSDYFGNFDEEGITPKNNKLMNKVWEMANSSEAHKIMDKIFNAEKDGYKVPASVEYSMGYNDDIPLEMSVFNFFIKYGKNAGLVDSDISFISKYKDLLAKLYKETGVEP